MAHPPRTGTQKALRITSIIMIIFGVLVALSGAIIIASGAAADSLGLNDAVNFQGIDAVNAMDPNDPDLVAGIAVGLVLGVVLVGSGVVDLVVGALGLRGARDPRKVKPFFVLCVIGLAIEVAGDVWLAAQGMLSSIGASGAVELLVIGACTWLAYDIMRQSRGIEA